MRGHGLSEPPGAHLGRIVGDSHEPGVLAVKLDDQQRLGRYLLVIGFMIVAVLAYKLVWGRNDPSRAS